MKVKINNLIYTQIRNLSFSPETDITGSSLPVNQFFVEIKTDDVIGVGINAYLYDDQGDLWAKYWITESVVVDEGWYKVTAQSIILLLDRFTLPAVVYSGESVTNVLNTIFATISAVYPSETVYTLDSALASATVTGYCPEQTARDRLLWVIFSICGYLKTYFNEYAEIVKLDTTLTAIPENVTFWKPEISYGDYVTAVKVRAYTYVQGTPQATDTWVTDGVNYYIQTYQDFTLTNPNIPITVTDNIVFIDKVTLVNQSNAATILGVLSQYYFKRIEVKAEVLDDGEYLPGDKCQISNGDRLLAGFIIKADFKFGTAKKASLQLVQSDVLASAKLILQYMWGNVLLKKLSYLLPVGYVYSVSNPYIDKVVNSHRYIFRPQAESASGTMVSGGVTDTEQYDVALDWYDLELYVVSVDELSESNEVVSIE